MPVQRFYSSVAQPTTLTGNISSGVTTIGVASPTGFPTSYPFTVAVDWNTATEELMDVTAASLGIWTVTRGVDGTSAQSHSIGAVVRHTSSGRDFAEAQAHAAATGAVHGVAGTLVGTSDTQTLANKTLTSPTVNSGALSGTFTGSPTFSGAPAFSGGGSLAGTFTGSPTLSGSPAFTGEPRLQAGAFLSRTNAADLALRASLAADTGDRLQMRADGQLLFGSGSAAPDTNLYRSGVGVLTTDSTLRAANLPAAWTSGWKPAWGTSTGLHAPSYGNAVTGGAYMKISRLLTFSFSMTFGSGTGFGAGATTNDNWTLSLPNSLAATSAFAGTDLICGFGRATQAAGATIPFSVRVDSGGTNFVMDTAGGRQDGVSMTNTGLLDSVTPWAWTSGNTVQFWGSVETTV